MANQDIDNFIRGLDYDPHKILAVAQDGDVSTHPLTTSRKENHEVVVCKTTEHKLTKNLSEVAILSQAAAAFPGALLIADEQLQRGTPTPIGLPRGKLKMTLLIPGNLRQPLDVDPTVSGVQLFLNQELEDWNKHTESNENHQNYGNAENTFVNYSTAYSKQQVAASLGFKAEWASGAASAQLDASSTTERSVVFCYYKQVFYTVKIRHAGGPVGRVRPIGHACGCAQRHLPPQLRPLMSTVSITAALLLVKDGNVGGRHLGESARRVKAGDAGRCHGERRSAGEVRRYPQERHLHRRGHRRRHRSG